MVSVGTVEYVVGSTAYHTWYKILGSLEDSTKRPLVLVHGGPGMSHDYMACHEGLFLRTNIPIIMYDQIGNGNSSHVLDKPESFWNVDLFMNELENLLKHLNIFENFDLLGHSWGGVLAGHYAAIRQPKGLCHLVIANAPASMELVAAGFNDLLNSFPEETREMVKTHEANNDTSSAEYREFVGLFQRKYICNLDPWPQGLMDSFAAVAKNPTVLRAMRGYKTFQNQGTLADCSIIPIAHQILPPTLLISAPMDEVQPKAVWPWFLKISKVKWVEFQDSTHLPQFEEPDKYLDVLSQFLEN